MIVLHVAHWLVDGVDSKQNKKKLQNVPMMLDEKHEVNTTMEICPASFSVPHGGDRSILYIPTVVIISRTTDNNGLGLRESPLRIHFEMTPMGFNPR